MEGLESSVFSFFVQQHNSCLSQCHCLGVVVFTSASRLVGLELDSWPIMEDATLTLLTHLLWHCLIVICDKNGLDLSFSCFL